MRILIATPILFDKSSPFNHLLRAILEGLTAKGHHLTRLVAVENRQDTGYDLGLESSQISYIPVRRKRAAHSNIISRYLMDSWTNFRMARKLRKLEGDVLFEDVSYCSWLTVRAAKKRGMQVVAMLQDVWPDNAVQSGLIRENSCLYRFFEGFQRYVYGKADRIICISDDMKAFVASKGVPEEKIHVIYNWGYSDDVVEIPWQENEFVKKYDLSPDIFYAVYAGNIGRMQNVELVVEAAKLLCQRKDIQFLIIGDGARREAIEALVNENGLENVTMLPMQPSSLAEHIYSAAGVNIIPLVPGGVKTAMPSKTGVVLSCGRPVIFAFGKDARFSATVEATGAGFCVDPSDPQQLARRILTLSECGVYDSQKVWNVFKQYFVKCGGVARYEKVIAGE